MSDPRRFQTGWLVHPEDRAALLERIAPRYADVVAHHVTQKFGDCAAPPPIETDGLIIGEADDGQGVQALVVEIGGTPKRPDGAIYHITWSLAPGRMAKESNDVIRALGWTRLAQPLPVRLEPRPSGG
jgi:hypothetical protein